MSGKKVTVSFVKPKTGKHKIEIEKNTTVGDTYNEFKHRVKHINPKFFIAKQVKKNYKWKKGDEQLFVTGDPVPTKEEEEEEGGEGEETEGEKIGVEGVNTSSVGRPPNKKRKSEMVEAIEELKKLISREDERKRPITVNISPSVGAPTETLSGTREVLGRALENCSTNINVTQSHSGQAIGVLQNFKDSFDYVRGRIMDESQSGSKPDGKGVVDMLYENMIQRGSDTEQAFICVLLTLEQSKDGDVLFLDDAIQALNEYQIDNEDAKSRVIKLQNFVSRKQMNSVLHHVRVLSSQVSTLSEEVHKISSLKDEEAATDSNLRNEESSTPSGSQNPQQESKDDTVSGESQESSSSQESE